MAYTIAVCTVKNFWCWTEELSETCRVLFQEKFREISANSWFYYKKLNTMHGHMNIKKEYFPFMNIDLLVRAISLLYFVNV